MEQELEIIQNKLKDYEKEDIVFNEPHFTNQLILREGNREEVIDNLLNPDKLMHATKECDSRGNVVYNLFFKISRSRTMKLPVVFGKKGLYIKTYIMRYRRWQNMVRRKWQKK